MLVLTRKYQEKIRIGNNITITVLRMKGKAVRLGIEAPENVPVVRGELSFESEAEGEVAEATVDGEASDSSSARDGRTIARSVEAAADWSANSKSDEKSRSGGKPTVKFQRMSREKLAEVLPGLVNSAGPLRAMMQR